jgi:hypothetical protein
MEDLLEDAFRGISSVVRWVLINFFVEIIIHWTGRISLLIITFGNYPRSQKVEEDETFITIFGFAVFIVFVTFLILSNG